MLEFERKRIIEHGRKKLFKKLNYAQTKKICYTSCETYVKNPASGTIERRHLLFLVAVQIVVLVIVIMITEHLRRKNLLKY